MTTQDSTPNPDGTEDDHGGELTHRSRPLPQLDPRLNPTLTIEEVAQVLGISRSSAYNAATSGEIPTIKLGRRLLVPTAWASKQLMLDNAEFRMAS